MAQPYQLLANFDGVLRVADQAHIPNHGGNADWQRFLAWQAEGNTPDPVRLGPVRVSLERTLEERVKALEETVNGYIR